MHLHGQREPFPPGTVAEGSCWTFPGKFRIWMRVPSSALLPASCTWARQPSDPCAGHSPPQDTTPGHFPGSHPEGHRAALPQAAARLFHPKPVPCRTQSEKKNQPKKPSDRHSKITFCSRGSAAGDWLLVWPGKCLWRKGKEFPWLRGVQQRAGLGTGAAGRSQGCSAEWENSGFCRIRTEGGWGIPVLGQFL